MSLDESLPVRGVWVEISLIIIEGIAWLCFVLCEENTFVSTTSRQSRNYYIFEIAKNTKKLSLFTT